MVNLAEEKLLLDIPGFHPRYDEKTEYGYKNKPGKNLDSVLRKASNNHCMYCYALLKSDRIKTGNLEHSIEKDLDKEHLTECVPNISIACSNCNQSLKRQGEKKRLKALEDAKNEFTLKVNCIDKRCRIGCEAYSELKKEYCKKSQIILQPTGVTGKDSEQPYHLQYDIYNAEFIPSQNYQYDEYDKNYIKHHINQFKLNDAGMKTKALADFVEDVIEADGKYVEKREYSNLIVNLFKETLKDMSQDEVLKLCEQIYTKYVITFKV